MSEAERIPPSDAEDGEHSAAPPTKPDWLVGADQITSRDEEDVKATEVSTRLRATAPLRLVEGQTSRSTPEASKDGVPDSEPPSETHHDGARDSQRASEASAGGSQDAESPSETPADEPASVWKAAASSVPRLRQRPVASTRPEAAEGFTGFAQDTMAAKSMPGGGARGAAIDLPDAGPGSDPVATPLAQEPPFWEQWLEQLRALPRPVAIGIAAVLVLGVAVYAFWPRGGRGASLAQIRQHPEGFEGRSVRVSGRAGEAFAVGGSFVFNLYQGRDTIVVYSPRRPSGLNARVKVSGTVSIGYLDGVPRVALLESPAAP